MKFNSIKNNRWAMAAIAVAVLSVTQSGIAQAARRMLPLPPVVIGYETGTVNPGPSEYPAVSPTPMPKPDLAPPPFEPLN